jgi:3-isopropylmalate/(R)-2-methylmalate dehydratase small subunit
MTTRSTESVSSTSSQRIVRAEGRGIPLRGNDIDTDRIMPARYLRVVSFEGLEQHLFEDDRKSDPQHPFNDPRYTGATLLVVNGNFGCGSSREHAPQGLARFGIRAIVGESFSEIFQGNSAMLGIPCFAADRASIDKLQELIEQTPDVRLNADVASGTIIAGALRLQATVPAALRDGFVSGQWDPTSLLLDQFEDVRAVANRLPYISGF